LDHCWQDEDDLFNGNVSSDDVKRDAMNYFNHSCDPNCWFATDNHITARFDIPKDTEITIDYATCDSTFIAIDNCSCGKLACRKSVLPTDYKLPRLLMEYENHFRFYLLRKIEEDNKIIRTKEAAEQALTTGKTKASGVEKKTEEDYKLIEMDAENRGQGIMFQMHKSIEVRYSQIEGRGLYATKFLPRGTVVWQSLSEEAEMWTEINESQVKDMDDEKKRLVTYYYEMASNMKLRGPICMEYVERDASNFYNHSCDPNTWFINDDKLAALRDIQPGEEITYDYATCKPQITKAFDCRCSTKKCRKRVTQQDYKLAQLRTAYGNHWVSHWLKIMASESQSS